MRNDTVTLMEADNDYDEADQVSCSFPASFLQVAAGCWLLPARLGGSPGTPVQARAGSITAVLQRSCKWAGKAQQLLQSRCHSVSPGKSLSDCKPILVLVALHVYACGHCTAVASSPALLRFADCLHCLPVWCPMHMQVVLQLRQWHNAGYVWGEMAVLFRNRFHVSWLTWLGLELGTIKVLHE